MGLIYFTVACYIGAAIGTAIDKHISDRKQQEMLDEIIKSRSLIDKLIEAKKESDNQLGESYKEIVKEVIKGKVPSPPNILDLKIKDLEKAAEKSDEWALTLKGMKGMEKQQIEMEKIARDAEVKLRNAQLDAKWIPYIPVVISQFKEVIDELNKKPDVFNGEIQYKVSEPETVISSTGRSLLGLNFSTTKIMEIDFPNRREWKVNANLPIPKTEEGLENVRLSINIIGGNFNVSFTADSPIDIIRTKIKEAFEKEISLNP